MDSGTAHPRFERLEAGLRDRILDAALGEFGRFGYRGASMNRVVSAAGISKGALFKYFGSKAGLFDYICRWSFEEARQRLRRVRGRTRQEPFFDRLSEVLRTGLDFTQEHPMAAAVYYRVLSTGDVPDVTGVPGLIRDASRRFLSSLVEEGIRSGELAGDLDLEKTTFVLQSVFDRLLRVHYLAFVDLGPQGEKGETLDEPVTEGAQGIDSWSSEIIRLLRHGMGATT